MKWLLSLLGIGSGPVGWLALAASWGSSALKFAREHWKAIAVAIAVAALFFGGAKWGSDRTEAKWQKKEAARIEHEREVTVMRNRIKAERNAVIEVVEEKAQKGRAARQVENKKIDKEVDAYVERHSQPDAPGACPTDTDIGTDGLQLIERVRRARKAGSDSSH